MQTLPCSRDGAHQPRYEIKVGTQNNTTTVRVDPDRVVSSPVRSAMLEEIKNRRRVGSIAAAFEVCTLSSLYSRSLRLTKRLLLTFVLKRPTNQRLPLDPAGYRQVKLSECLQRTVAHPLVLCLFQTSKPPRHKNQAQS